MFPNGLRPVKITIYNSIPFSNNYSDHLFRPIDFHKGNEQYNSLDMKSFLSVTDEDGDYKFLQYSMVDNFNFDYGNGLVTSIVLELPTTMTSCNYMMVETTGGGSSSIFYFFVTSITELSANESKVTCKLSLELDVLATYQSSIIDSLENVPINVERKHCQRFSKPNSSNKYSFYCTDLLLEEPYFSNVKPNIVTKKEELTPKYRMGDTYWLYLTLSQEESLKGTILGQSLINNMPFYLETIAIPISHRQFKINYLNSNGTLNKSLVLDRSILISKYQGSPNVICSKLSPYSPIQANIGITYSFDSTNDMVIVNIPSGHWQDETLSPSRYTRTYIYDTKDRTINSQTLPPTTNELISIDNDTDEIPSQNYASIHCIKQTETKCEYNDVSLDYRYITKLTPSVARSELNEPKLRCSPYKKVAIKTIYSNETEIKMQYVYSVYASSPSNANINIYTINTMFGGDTTLYTSYNLSPITTTYRFNDYTMNGINSSPSYFMPYGTDALKTFIQTQHSQFATQKIAQGVTGALAVAGGIAMAVASYGASSGVSAGMIAGGMSAIGGAVSAGTAIAECASKTSDLENTPETISNLGSNIIHDFAVKTTLYPYLIEYELPAVEKEMILDYFYNYGYLINRECYFNKELDITNYSTLPTGYVDKRIFTRQVFNYVKTKEDISSKMYKQGVMPLIVKEKIESIFNNGIKLWSFFNYPNIQNDDIVYCIDTYLYKNDYENAEIV